MQDADFKRFAKCPKMSVFQKKENVFKLLTFSTVYSVCCFFCHPLEAIGNGGPACAVGGGVKSASNSFME